MRWCDALHQCQTQSGVQQVWKSRECRLVYFCPPPPAPSTVDLAARDQFRVEESWCLAWGALGHRFCHCPQLPPPFPPHPAHPFPFPPATLWPSSPLGHPLLPRLPNEEWHASGGPDLVWSRGPCLLCFVFHYWLQWLTVSRGDESGFIPKRHRSRIAGGAQRAEAIVWNCEDLIVFIHELCDWY